MTAAVGLICRGVNRRGVAFVSHSTTPPADLVHDLFGRGCRVLTVTDETGTEVGGIGRHPDTGRRTWWASDGTAGVTHQGGAG